MRFEPEPPASSSSQLSGKQGTPAPQRLWQGGEEFPGETEAALQGEALWGEVQRGGTLWMQEALSLGARGPSPGGEYGTGPLLTVVPSCVFAQHLTQRVPRGKKLNLTCSFGYSYLLIHCL